MNTKHFPRLYKLTSTGATQAWLIGVYENEDGHGVIKTSYGLLGGAIQTTEDVIKVGKNAGKKNATTPYEQACKEAESRWKKQNERKGYVEDIERAALSESDRSGGTPPMLAHVYDDHSTKIEYPAYVQPKLDGIRCIAKADKDGVYRLWSREGREFTGVPHIAKHLTNHFRPLNVDSKPVLDGELYVHAYRKDFEKIVSLVRQKEPAEGHEIVEYHIYDVINELVYSDRLRKLEDFLDRAPTHLHRVFTGSVANETDMMKYFHVFRHDGYEGAMVRNRKGLYVGKRSYDLQKVKSFQEGEFRIAGIEEGRGRLAGHVGAFVCYLHSPGSAMFVSDLSEEGPATFRVKMEGDTARLKEYFENHELWKNKIPTVKYQNLTADGVPRFPVGKSIRDYEG